MDKGELLDLIKTGEGYTLEFKERMPSDLGRQLCAFANASGGRIILGVRDDGTASDYRLSNQDEANINATARNLDPAFRITVEKVDGFAVVHIPEGENKPYSSGGQFYLRIGSTSQQLRRDEIREFFLKERMVRFDEKPNKDFDFKEDFNHAKFQEYLKRATIPSLTNEKNILRNLNLLDGDQIRNAGVLFFSSHIKKFFISASVVCVLFQGTSKETILDRKEFDEDIVSNYENAFTYLCSRLNTNYLIQAERTERLELPKDALREALINAIVHRDYFSTSHIQVDIYYDRVEISNPGGLVSGLDRKDFGKGSRPRNPLLMDLFLRLDKVEKVGSGIKRIRKAMKDYGLSPKFDIRKDWFSLVFPRSIQPATTQKTREKTREKLLDLIKINPSITTEELAIKLELTIKGIEWQISRLKLEGILKRVGPDKGGHWEVKGD